MQILLYREYFSGTISWSTLALLAAFLPFIERDVGYWLAYLVPTIVYGLVPIVLYIGRKRYVRTPPKGSVVVDAVRIMRIVFRGAWSWNPFRMVLNLTRRVNWDDARPTADNRSRFPNHNITWDNDFVDEMKRTLYACKVFLLYPFYWVSYNQMSNNLINQAAYLNTNGTPNDLLGNLDPITVIIIIPIMDRIVYPGLRRFGIVVRPIRRITLGFFVAAAGMFYAGILQELINRTNPCGRYGGTCDGHSPISVWFQSPAYILIGISEIFTSITGLEYAYTKAPLRMKSVVFALFYLMGVFSSIMNLALVGMSVDPYVEWNYLGCGAMSLIAGTAFWKLFRNYDEEEDSINAIGQSAVRRIE